MADQNQRHSQALEVELISDPQLKAEAEARNGLRQFDYGIQTIYQALERGVLQAPPLPYSCSPARSFVRHKCVRRQFSSGGGGNCRQQSQACGGSFSPGTNRGALRLCERQLGSEDRYPSCRIHNVATQLDSSICRWQWPYFADPFIRCIVNSGAECFSRHANYSGADRRESRSLF